MNYIYSTSPVPELRITLLLIIASAILMFIFFIMYRVTREKVFLVPLFIFSLFVPVSIYMDVNRTKDNTLNEPVTATLLPYSDNVEVTVTEGRTRVKRVRTLIYYKTPDGEVSFPRMNGAIYPEVAILYRNPIHVK